MTRSKAVQLLLLLLVGAVVWFYPVVASFRLGMSRDAHTYTLLILPISVTLIFMETRDVVLRGESGRWVGAVFVSVALLVRVCTVWNPWQRSSMENLSISIAGLVIWWIGCTILCFGIDAFRAFLFPLCFLFLLVPMPDAAVYWITDVLQQQSALASSELFHVLGVPVVRDGVVLTIPGLTIEVAQECSSIRSSTMLIVVSLILAHLFLGSTWRKTVLVLLALPLSILKNGIRIVTIAELGTRVNPAFLHGRLHRHGGVVFLIVALLLELILLWVLRKSETRTAFQRGMRP